MDWLLGNAVGNIKLQTSQSEAEAAAILIAQHRARVREPAENETLEEADRSDTTPCLACGEPMPEDQSACPACGWSYTADSEA